MLFSSLAKAATGPLARYVRTCAHTMDPVDAAIEPGSRIRSA